MKKRILLIVLSAALLIAPLWSALMTAHAAGENQSTTTYTGIFSENFESGLDRWEIQKLQDAYTADFTIVTDPDDASNKALTHTRNGIFLVPKSDYWPSRGVNAGQMAKVTFRMKFPDNTFTNKTQTGPLLSYRDMENFSGTRLNINYNGQTGMHIMSQGMSEGTERPPKSGGINIQPFDNANWFDVTCIYANGKIEIVMTDSKGLVVSGSVENYAVDGKFAIGNRYYNNNNVRSTGNWLIDDIRVEFVKLSVDVNEEQRDVNVYYSGNTFLKPGETAQITGEQFGKTVGDQISIIKLPDTAVSASSADYIGEQNFDRKTDHVISWDSLKSGNSTLMTLPVAQMSDLGIKLILPNEGAYSTPGVYAVYIPAKHTGGQGAVVALNNPEIAFLLHDDGDGATPSGWLKLAGSNLSVQDDVSKVSAMIIDEAGNRTMVPNSQLYVDTTANNDGRDNEYYLQVNLNNMKPGKYQLMVHNGYGGHYGWSAPVEFTVKAQTARSQWEALGTFDVTDFGAKGDSYTNDTGAIIAAMAAAERNGGGIVYFPACNDSKAFYRITDTIYVPNNVTVLGDGSGNTNIFIDTIGRVDMPAAFFYYEQNLAVEGINIYGHLMKALFQKTATETIKAKSGYIYFKDVVTMIDSDATISNGKGTILEGYTNDQVRYYVAEQKMNGSGTVSNSTGVREKFVSFVDVDLFRRGAANGSQLTQQADYAYLSNEKNYGYSMLAVAKAGILEDCYSDSGVVGTGSGNLMYRNGNFSNSTSNNRELLCTDGHSNYIDCTVEDLNQVGKPDQITLEELVEREGLSAEQKQQIQDYINANPGRAFRTATQFDWSLTYCRMYVTDGQGAGQERRIAEGSMKKIGSYLYFTVENEFAVNPNRNSKITFYGDRVNWFVTNCDFSNGRHVGPYGTIINSVFDGNAFDYSSSGVEVAANQGAIWYLTAKDNTADNIMIGHTIFIRAYPSGLTAGNMQSSLSFFGIQYRNNTMGQGGYYHVGSGAVYRPVLEVLFEGNVGYSDSAIFRNVSLCEGMWLRNNTRYNTEGKVESAYSNALIADIRNSGTNTTNKYGFLKCVCDVYGPTGTNRPKGDVNNDGLVTYKDVELIKQHIAEVITLVDTKNDKALTYADVTGDTVVDMKDVITLICIIEGKPAPDFQPSDPNPGEDYEDESDEYFDGCW